MTNYEEVWNELVQKASRALSRFGATYLGEPEVEDLLYRLDRFLDEGPILEGIPLESQWRQFHALQARYEKISLARDKLYREG